jgi:hypothetical protein
MMMGTWRHSKSEQAASQWVTKAGSRPRGPQADHLQAAQHVNLDFVVLLAEQ